MRESFRIGDDVPVFIARDLPTIVDDHILIAGIFHSAADHRVCNAPNQVVSDIAGELVPAIPSHGWCFREPILERKGRDGCKATDKDEERKGFAKEAGYGSFNGLHVAPTDTKVTTQFRHLNGRRTSCLVKRISARGSAILFTNPAMDESFARH
jgi:hypothetical protein